MSITVVMLCFILAACSNTAFQNTFETDANEEPVVEYYENSTVPKIDSVLEDVAKMDTTTEYNVYGPYNSSEEATEVIEQYASILTDTYGFNSLNYTFAYKLSDGQNSVTCINGTYDGYYTIGVIIDEAEN